MSRFRHLRKSPRQSPSTPPGIFAEAEWFVLHVANDVMATEVYCDILKACDRQRDFDPRMTWIVRKPDGAVLKVRNGSSVDLRRLVQRHGGHL